MGPILLLVQRPPVLYCLSVLAESVRQPAAGRLGSHGVLYFIVSVLTESIREPAEGPLGSH